LSESSGLKQNGASSGTPESQSRRAESLQGKLDMMIAKMDAWLEGTKVCQEETGLP
jgi:hypothetical protein